MAFTNATLRTYLAANYPGITIDDTEYPDSESMLTVVSDMLSAARAVQDAHNLAAPAGEDIQLIDQNQGAEQNRDFGGAIGVKRVRQLSRSVTVFEEVVPGPVYPILV